MISACKIPQTLPQRHGSCCFFSLLTALQLYMPDKAAEAVGLLNHERVISAPNTSLSHLIEYCKHQASPACISIEAGPSVTQKLYYGRSGQMLSNPRTDWLFLSEFDGPIHPLCVGEPSVPPEVLPYFILCGQHIETTSEGVWTFSILRNRMAFETTRSAVSADKK